MQRKKVIAYVSTKDLPMMQENDIKMLDVINLAFGHIQNDAVVYEPGENAEYFAKIKALNPECAIVLSVGGWSAGGFSEAASTQKLAEACGMSSGNSNPRTK